jgi:Protein of unknown function (DUF2846)
MFKPRLSQFFFAGAAPALLPSCATVQREAAPSEVDRPLPGKALVIFYRERHFTGGGMGYVIRNNGTKIGGLPNGSYFVYQASPGPHQFTASTAVTEEKEINVVAGKTYYIRGEVQMGIFMGRPHLTFVTAEEGASAIKDLRRVKLRH